MKKDKNFLRLEDLQILHIERFPSNHQSFRKEKGNMRFCPGLPKKEKIKIGLSYHKTLEAFKGALKLDCF